MTNQPAIRTQKAATTRATTAPAAQAGTKIINEEIAVTDEPKDEDNKDDDASCFTPSGKTCRTPQKSTTRPHNPPGAPSKHKPRQMSPFDTTESDNEDEEKTTAHMEANAKKKAAPTQTVGSIGHLINVLRKAKDKLSKQHTSGGNLEIKSEVIKDIEEAIQEANTVQDNYIDNIENNLKEIKDVLNDVLITTITTINQSENSRT